ncbi:MAG: hydratase [Alphaproteobacteria bacterium]|nr:MAG: hydratase [Alphaproteobacteria bacterium]
MTPETRARAAALLLAARRERRPLSALPAEYRPRTLADGYGIQSAWITAAGGRVVGFKIGATSRKAQEYLGIAEPFYGCILDDVVFDSPAALSAGDYLFRLIEPEFALRLGRDLPPRPGGYTMNDLARAVNAVHPALEVVNSAYGAAWTDAGALALIADNGVNAALVLGPATADWHGFDLATHAVTFRRNNEEVGCGVGGHALGHPLAALAWLADQDVCGGRGLKAGDIVTTGVVTPFVHAEAGDDLTADFGSLGKVRLRFTTGS